MENLDLNAQKQIILKMRKFSFMNEIHHLSPIYTWKGSRAAKGSVLWQKTWVDLLRIASEVLDNAKKD